MQEQIIKSIDAIGEKINALQAGLEKTDKAVFDMAQKSAAPAPGAEQVKKSYARTAAEQIVERREELIKTGRLAIDLDGAEVMSKALKGAPAPGPIQTTNVPSHTQLPLGVEGSYPYSAAAAFSIENNPGASIIHFSKATAHGEAGTVDIVPEGDPIGLVAGVWTDVQRKVQTLGGATVLSNVALSSVPSLETACGVILQNSLARRLDQWATQGNGGDWGGLKSAKSFTSTFKDLPSGVLEGIDEGAKRGVAYDSIVLTPAQWRKILTDKNTLGDFLLPNSYLENPAETNLRGLRVILSETVSAPTLVSSANASLIISQPPQLLLALNADDHLRNQVTARLVSSQTIAEYIDYYALQLTLAA